MTQRIPPGLSPTDVAHLRARAKRVLRDRIRQTRRTISPASVQRKSAQIVQHLLQLEALQAADGIGLYWPMLQRAEVDLRPLDRSLRKLGKRLYYPFMRAKEGTSQAGESVVYDTGFARVEQIEDLVESRGFFQPGASAPAAPRGAIQLILAPALAASSDLHRLGYGLGYYDSTLPDYCPPAQVIVVVFDFQLVAELPVEPHDFKCHAVLTESRVFAASSEPAPSNG